MTTPLQKAAQALINRWDSPAWKDQPHTAEYIEGLRKALDAELQQAVEPYGWLAHGLSRLETGKYAEDNARSDAKRMGYGAYAFPLYLHPPQQATTAVPEGYVLVPIEPTPAMLDAMSSSGWKYASYKAMLAAAQGEKP